MNTKVTIGNDLVVFHLKETKDKSRHQRFVERVFTPNEARLIRTAADPEAVLWDVWSAKESAYKVAKKINPKTVFAHRRFEVDRENGVVRFGNLTVPVSWTRNENYVHCIGINSEFVNQRSLIKFQVMKMTDAFFSSCDRSSLSNTELTSVRSRESLCVRYLAKDMLLREGYEGVEILTRNTEGFQRCPVIYRSNKRIPGIEISFSHHGGYVAVALLNIQSFKTAEQFVDNIVD